MAMKMSNREIAAGIRRDDSVVCREITRNGGRAGYRAVAAQHRAEAQRRRPKARKLDEDPRLRDHVFAGATWLQNTGRSFRRDVRSCFHHLTPPLSAMV
jgi:IS30 family transposase